MGAYDQNGLTLKIIDILKKLLIFDKKYKILIILGAHHQTLKSQRYNKGIKEF